VAPSFITDDEHVQFPTNRNLIKTEDTPFKEKPTPATDFGGSEKASDVPKDQDGPEK